MTHRLHRAEEGRGEKRTGSYLYGKRKGFSDEVLRLDLNSRNHKQRFCVCKKIMIIYCNKHT